MLAQAAELRLASHPAAVAKRLGILTFHRCINYGSYWQARCLVDGLRAMGADAVLLDHHCSRATRAELRCALSPTLPQRTTRSDFPAYVEKTRKFHRAFERLPLSRRFPIDGPQELEEYDAVIVGSDEVWNLRHPWYGGCSTFYGAGIESPLISYAASFGNQDVSEGLGKPSRQFRFTVGAGREQPADRPFGAGARSGRRARSLPAISCTGDGQGSCGGGLCRPIRA